MSTSRSVSRRAFFQQSLLGTAGLVAGARVLSARAPGIIQADGSLPATTQGVAAGAAGPDRFVVWSRCDRPARQP